MMQKILSRSKFADLAGVNPSTVTRLCKTLLLGAVVGKAVDAAHPDAVSYLKRQDDAHTPQVATGLDALYEKVVQFCRTSGKYTKTAIQSEFKIGHVRTTNILGVMAVNSLIPEKGQPPKFDAQEIQEKLDTFNRPAPRLRGNAAVNAKKKAAGNLDDEIVEIPEDIQSFLDFTLGDLIEKFGTDIRFVDWLNATQKIEGINEKRLKNAATKGKLISRELVKNGVIDVFNSAHLRLLKDGAKSIAAAAVSKHAGGAELVEIENYITDILGSFIKPVKAKIERVLKDA